LPNNKQGKLKENLIEKIGSLDYRRPELDEVLDEAKKEFPIVENITRATPEGQFNFFIYDTNKVDAWFTKWFGEEPAKQ